MKDKFLERLLLFIVDNPHKVKSFKTKTTSYVSEGINKEGELTGETKVLVDYEIEFFENTMEQLDDDDLW